MQDLHIPNFEAGIQEYARMFRAFMDRNRFSHPVMVSLAKSSLGGASWLHSSQISGMRHGKLRSPGPRIFEALAQLNRCLYRYKHYQELIPGTSTASDYLTPFVILDDENSPPSAGWWVEVFLGLRQATGIDFGIPDISPDEAPGLSRRLSRLVRILAAQHQIDVLEETPSLLRDHCPDREPAVVKLLSGWLGGEELSYQELTAHISSIQLICDSLGGPKMLEELMDAVA